MQESGSEFDDGYGSDLMGDDADRSRLAAMNELQRELELADRAERRDEMKERRQTAWVLKQQQQAAAKAKSTNIYTHIYIYICSQLSAFRCHYNDSICIYSDKYYSEIHFIKAAENIGQQNFSTQCTAQLSSN